MLKAEVMKMMPGLGSQLVLLALFRGHSVGAISDGQSSSVEVGSPRCETRALKAMFASTTTQSGFIAPV
jgi:hypothetical protein